MTVRNGGTLIWGTENYLYLQGGTCQGIVLQWILSLFDPKTAPMEFEYLDEDDDEIVVSRSGSFYNDSGKLHEALAAFSKLNTISCSANSEGFRQYMDLLSKAFNRVFTTVKPPLTIVDLPCVQTYAYDVDINDSAAFTFRAGEYSIFIISLRNGATGGHAIAYLAWKGKHYLFDPNEGLWRFDDHLKVGTFFEKTYKSKYPNFCLWGVRSNLPPRPLDKAPFGSLGPSPG